MSDSATSVALTHAPGAFAPGHLGELTQVVPFEMVDAALDDAGRTQRRVRLLPSRVVVYLLLAGALFAGQGWRQVWHRLTAGLGVPVTTPSAAAITEAMRRVGPSPLKNLFGFLKGPAPTGAGQTVKFAGRLVAAIDGTQIAVPDTPANLAQLPKSAGGPNGSPGYPMVRLVAIMTAGTRQVIDAVFGTDQTGELSYATRLVGTLRPGTLLLADRNFAVRAFWNAITATGADFLIRAKTGTRALKLPVMMGLRDGSYLSQVGGLTVRVIDAELAITTEAGTRTGIYRLVTTLLDPDEAPAQRLLILYHQRWEIETAYCELKSTILGGRVLRGRHPAALAQEVWALLCAYQVLRTAMTDATLARPAIVPDRASFTIALNTARDQIIQAAGIITETTVDLVGRIGAAILDNLLGARRTRTRTRAVKRAISKYRAKTREVDRRTYPATLTSRILTPAPDD